MPDDPFTAFARDLAKLDNREAWATMATWVRTNIPRRPGWRREAARVIWSERTRLITGGPSEVERLQQWVSEISPPPPPPDPAEAAAAEKLAALYDDEANERISQSFSR